jgi:hypothetical protein
MLMRVPGNVKDVTTDSPSPAVTTIPNEYIWIKAEKALSRSDYFMRLRKQEAPHTQQIKLPSRQEQVALPRSRRRLVSQASRCVPGSENAASFRSLSH